MIFIVDDCCCPDPVWWAVKPASDPPVIPTAHPSPVRYERCRRYALRSTAPSERSDGADSCRARHRRTHRCRAQAGPAVAHPASLSMSAADCCQVHPSEQSTPCATSAVPRQSKSLRVGCLSPVRCPSVLPPLSMTSEPGRFRLLSRMPSRLDNRPHST